MRTIISLYAAESVGVRAAKDEDTGLITLNYGGESPKDSEIARECRSLIVNEEGEIISRSFCRFFNEGEMPHRPIDWRYAYVMEKVDGSLIKFFYHDGLWHIATSSCSDAGKAKIQGFGMSYKDLVLKAIGLTEKEFQSKCNLLNATLTYIFEVVSPLNRVVKLYKKTALYYLGSRNIHGDHISEKEALQMLIPSILYPQEYRFSSLEEIISSAKALPEMEEGYVLWDCFGPFVKIKSPSYVALHHLKGNVFSERRAIELVLTGNDTEYISVFCIEEHTKILKEVKQRLEIYLEEADSYYSSIKDIIEQKDFAAQALLTRFSFLLFEARKKDVTPSIVFWNYTPAKQMSIMEKEYDKMF